MFEMKLATCEALMGVLLESTDSLKASYLSRTGEHLPFGDRRFRGGGGSLRLKTYR